jgi:hypothetical protein
MTPEEHRKYVGLSHIVYGVIHIAMTGLSMLFVGVMIGTMPLRNGPRDVASFPFMVTFMSVALLINVLMGIPSFIAGYAFLKKRSWSKVMGIIAAVFAALHFPFGSAVCAYTFWFLFSDPGKSLYQGSNKHLPPPPPHNWAEVNQRSENQSYAPRLSPPDWR